MTTLIKLKKSSSSIPSEGTKCNVCLIKTDEVIAVGGVDDYAIGHKDAKKIGIKFTLKERLPFKDKDTTYAKYLYDKGENHILFHLDAKTYKTKDGLHYLAFKSFKDSKKSSDIPQNLVLHNKKTAVALFERFQKEFISLEDGIFSHIYVIDHNKETKEIDPSAIRKLESSGYKYRIDTTSDYSKRPTAYQQKYRVIKAVKSSLTLIIESAFSSTESIEHLLQSFQFWFKSHFHQAKIVGNSIFYHDKVEIQVSNKGSNLLVKFIPVS